jgi:hypothetical protein
MKKIILFLIIIAIATAIGFTMFNKPKNETAKNDENSAGTLTPVNAKYWIETDLVQLENGKAETINPYGAAKMTTEIIGQPVAGDLNSDGQSDYAVALKQQTENDPGAYYYVAIALVDEAKNMIVGSNAVAIGEGVKIEDIAIVNQAVRVNYLERNISGDEVESEPTIPVSKSYILDGVMFKELTPKRANAQAEAACTDNRGEWNKDENVCTGITQELCAQFGGNFTDPTCKF